VKILITGTRGLAQALGNAYQDHAVTLVSKSNGFDINYIEQWGIEFLDYDYVFNCAYDGFAQIKVLEFFFQHFNGDPTKKIISVGSRVISQPRSGAEVGYWDYRLHKQALQQAHDSMWSTAKCDMKIVNPGPIDTDMMKHVSCAKLDADSLAQTIKNMVSDPNLKRLDLWV
jgi:hypothetical protein